MIFINDLPEVIFVCIKLFADDAKLHTTVDSTEKLQCLQESLESAVEWADTWNMFYNDAKCHHLHIGSRDLGVNYVIPTHQGLTTKGWSGGAMVLGKLPVPGRPTIWVILGQGPIAFAVGAGGGCLDIFSLLYPFFSFSLSLGDGPI